MQDEGQFQMNRVAVGPFPRNRYPFRRRDAVARWFADKRWRLWSAWEALRGRGGPATLRIDTADEVTVMTLFPGDHVAVTAPTANVEDRRGQ